MVFEEWWNWQSWQHSFAVHFPRLHLFFTTGRVKGHVSTVRLREKAKYLWLKIVSCFQVFVSRQMLWKLYFNKYDVAVQETDMWRIYWLTAHAHSWSSLKIFETLLNWTGKALTPIWQYKTNPKKMKLHWSHFFNVDMQWDLICSGRV